MAKEEMTKKKAVKDKTAKEKAAKEIAMDKSEVDVSTTSKKKSSKTPKTKNPFKKLVTVLIPQKTDTKGEIARKIMLLAAIAILIGTLAFLIWQLVGMNNGGKNSVNIASLAGVGYDTSIDYREPDYIAYPDPSARTTAGDGDPEFIDLTPYDVTPLNVDFASLRAINPDVRGWIKIPGTLVNNVILQKPGDDDYYLTHDINGKESVSGEVFSSWRNKWDGTDDNIILFGHNMRSGYFFNYVRHYFPNDASREPLAFYKVHPRLVFQRDGGESETYKIFAGMLVNTEEENGEVFNYTTKTRFTSADDFNNYILDIMDRSWFYTDVDLQYGDKIITLSTCHWPLGKDVDTRWALFARKVRPGESEEVDTSVAERNWTPKSFTYYDTWRGRTWKGRTWDTSKLLSY